MTERIKRGREEEMRRIKSVMRGEVRITKEGMGETGLPGEKAEIIG